MAEIKAATNEKVFQITAFKGLNQAPDGDTKLKMGEAAEMNNFRITRDGNLQRRPGTKTIIDLDTDMPVKGLWHGYIGQHEYLLGACDGKLYDFWDSERDDFTALEIGEINTNNNVFIFGFSNLAYILDGEKYRQWDGVFAEPGEEPTYKEVEGYVPLVMTSIPPEGAASDESAPLENINRLTTKRRVWISPDGSGTIFHLPEADNIASIDSVVKFNSADPDIGYTPSAQDGTVTFASAPPARVNSYEITYSVNASSSLRSQVENMQYAELFSGVNDSRVFLYGDGTNRAIYSGIGYYFNMPNADYFPDLYDVNVGDENTPITSMIRHYSSLACFKTDSAWSISASSLTLADGLNIPAFHVVPVNKAIGNEAPGQTALVLNSPYTLFGNDLYEWKNSSYYTSNLTRDERQAKRISDRVWAVLKSFTTKDCICYDDNEAQEYYICYDGTALVYNYAADAWFKYTEFPVSSMANVGDDLYIGTPNGKLKRFGTDILSDDGEAIKAYWESGSMSFGQEYMRKYSAMTWTVVKPESSVDVTVSAKTDKKFCESKKIQTKSAQFEFEGLNFENLKFDIKRDTHVYREKIKAKKFVFYKLLFNCDSANTRCTVLSADIRVRFTGMAK